MDLLSFSLELVKILVWPLVVIIGLFAFRRPLEYLIPYLRRVKIKEFEAEFESGIDKINNAEQIIKLPERERKLDISVKALAENYPRAAILEIWTQIESLLKKTVGRATDKKTVSAGHMLEELRAKPGIPTSTIDALHELRLLRNRVAHVDETLVTPKQALAYVNSAGLVQQSIEEYFQEPPDLAGTVTLPPS